MSSLGGELKGSLLVRDLEDHVDSADDLLRFPALRIAAEEGSALERFFNECRSLHIRRACAETRASDIPEPPAPAGAGQGFDDVTGSCRVLDLVEARTHVFVMPLTYLKGLHNARYGARQGRCRFHAVRNPLSLTSVGMSHRKDLPPEVREAIEKRARYMTDSHIFERMIDTRVINYTRCLQEEADHVDALGIQDVHGVFYLYLAGVCASLVWMAIFLSWFLVALVSTLGESLLTMLSSGVGVAAGLGDYWDRLWVYLQFMLPQGCNKKTSSEFGRVLLCFWFLAMLVLMSSLGGELKGSLLVRDLEDHVDSVDDLLRFPALRIAAEKGSVHERFFNRPEHPTFRSLLPRLQPVRGSLTSPQVAASILDMVEARTHVFVLPLTYLKGLLNVRFSQREGRCRFHVVRNPLSLTSVGMFHRKDLPPEVREAIEKRARYMIDSHIFERMIDTRVINYTRCLREEEDHVDALGIQDVHGVFYLYLAGVCASLVGFGAELFCYVVSARKRRSRRELRLFVARATRLR
ncbi:hypothetical protein V5799_011213 [Amblyomma americanum]|uniref:Ionotropic glutamate receptor C-terminal domain-containing protein n=1 Tax=Amblyomma americanum TaxID=6943 RepID=A0AAQ4EHR1_AMBAM